MLEIQNLKAGYNSLEILHGIDLQVKSNEIVAVIGPNGAGKSTLLKSIFNLCSVKKGRIIFDNFDITKKPTFSLISKGICFVPQGRQIFSDLTVKENLELGAFTQKNNKIIQENLDNVFKQFPFLKEKQNALAFTLSGGQQQLLAIARALMQKPKLLLLDEPSLGLAPNAIKQVFEKIKEIKKQKIAVIIVEQNAMQAIKIADKIIVLEDGLIAFSGTKKQLKSKKLANIYFGGRQAK